MSKYRNEKSVVGMALPKGRKQESAQCSRTSMLNVFYLTTQHHRESGHIEGHAYLVFLLRWPTGHNRRAIQHCIHALESQKHKP